MTVTLSDETLMERVRLGSKDAFRDLMKRWQWPVYRFFCRMGANQSEAEDCVQDTFLRIFSYRRRYRNLGFDFRAFLFRIGRNVLVDFFRKRERTGRFASLETEPSTDDAVPLWNDRIDCEWALGLLPDRLRMVVVLNVYEGLCYREIAEALSVPVGTVKSRMHHALVRLREILHVENRV